MLTRDKLTDADWDVIRNTPHLVMLAVSGAGGSGLDEMLERKAGLRGIVEGMHSTLPLLREIAGSTEIMKAQDEIRTWVHGLPDSQRTPDQMQQRALTSMGRALDAIAAQGSPDDLSGYVDFVLATATRVAKAAREGDLLGFGGKLVSQDESEFIGKLESFARGKIG
jgi:hypothetical protein